jgi:hypothetical protein
LLVNFVLLQNISTEIILHNIVGSDGQYYVYRALQNAGSSSGFQKSVHYYIVVIGIIVKQTRPLNRLSFCQDKM